MLEYDWLDIIELFMVLLIEIPLFVRFVKVKNNKGNNRIINKLEYLNIQSVIFK